MAVCVCQAGVCFSAVEMTPMGLPLKPPGRVINDPALEQALKPTAKDMERRARLKKVRHAHTPRPIQRAAPVWAPGSS
jgi:hypothetical protein